ncbi:MAG: formamidopyrimidine-DNA glycosylase, partial [Actinomycetes bacterium]
AALAAALVGSATSLKTALLDQSRLAGVGNLIADETLWRARLDPVRPAGGLDTDEVAGLARTLRSTIRMLTRRGGAHTGDLQEQRRRDGRCPRCGDRLDRRTIGGRTTYSCPSEQR